MYQSSQFFCLTAVNEARDQAWSTKLRRDMQGHLSHRREVDLDQVPGFLSVVNVVYTTTEVFEFAARLCEAGVYEDHLEIFVELHGVSEFALAAPWARAWMDFYQCRTNEVLGHWPLRSSELVSSSRDLAIDAAVFLFERFGWLNPNTDVLKADQKKLLEESLTG